MTRQTPYFPLGGGLDVVTPIVQIPEGRMIAGNNFEPWINGGYRRILGYERFDGRPAPSEATFRQITLDAIGALVVGDTITGDTSSATGVIVAVSGNLIAVTKINGTFQLNETINTSAAEITAISSTEAAPDVATEEAWLLAAENEYRDDITVVPGEGPVRGFWQCRDRRYAIRNNVGSTAGILHRATASGWTTSGITLVHTLRFDAGTGAWAEGEVVTGGTSGATGTVHRVISFGGAPATNDEFGYLALTSVTGTFSDNEAITGDGTGAATANGASAQFALDPGGRYDFITHNFLAGSDTYRTYGCQGVGPAFEIDENNVVTPILLDLTFGDAPSENNPYLVEEFDGALWLMFPGGSLQKSITGDPLTFNGFLGAAEFGLSDEGTGLINSAGKVLVAFTRRQAHGFFPLSGGGYEKRFISDRSGAILYSEEEVDTILALDDSGIIDLQRAERFGDFANATVSDLVQPIAVGNIPKVIGSMAIRETNQYRILYNDGTGLIMRRKPDGAAEFATFNYGFGNDLIHACYACEDENSKPNYWVCGSDGFVYQCERGRNFDGAEIESFLRLPFVHSGSPSVQKRYRLAEVELKAERNVTLVMAQDRDFGDQITGTNTWNEDISTVFGGGGFYDIDTWDEVYWDSQVHAYARFELYGTGRNVSLLIYHRTATTRPFILQGVILHFDPRRTNR